MLNVDNSVLETEIANLLNRSNAKIVAKRTVVNVRKVKEGRLRCRIEISGDAAHGGIEASFEDLLREGFFLRAERSLSLQLEPGAATGNTIPKL